MKKIFLETKRLVIYQPALEDFEEQCVLQSNEEVMIYVGSGARDKDDVYHGLVSAIEHQEKYGFSLGSVYEKATGKFMGRAGLIHLCFDETQPDIEFGYAFLKEFWDKGYGTELAKGLIDWGFKNIPVNKLVAAIISANDRSRHVLEKAGMHYARQGYYQSIRASFYEIFRNPIDFSKLKLVPAKLADYPTVQNMARFYVYEMSEYLGRAPGWEIPKNGLYECMNFKVYWEMKNCFPFLIHYDNELAGFVIVDKMGSDATVDFNMAQFFILAKFKRKGVGRFIATQCFDHFKGRWEVMVMRGNEAAYRFWFRVIRDYTKNNFSEDTLNIAHFNNQERNIFKFESR